MNNARTTLLLGGETEYAVGATDHEGKAIGQQTLLPLFMQAARHALPYTSVSPNGRFLSNGSKLYLDGGLHMEWATCECTTPHDVARYLRAGDRLMLEMAEEYRTRTAGVAHVFVSRCNVDYVSHTAWASHENYLHRADADLLPPQMVPFLASRVVLAGAGGWDCLSPGLRFTLSPRFGFITRVTSDDSQSVRPLFHTKNEQLSDTGTSRLHVACSESLCSDVATVLRFGTTALVLALVEDGTLPGTPVILKAPLTAVRLFAGSTSWRDSVALADGRRLTAVEIQRHYLEAVEARLDAWCMPDWGESVCALWRRTLDDLEQDPARCQGRLDWAIKQNIYADFLRKHGIEWDALPRLNAALERHLAKGYEAGPMPEDLAAVLQLRPKLLELDMRFGDVGERGVFNALDRAGALRHRVDGVDHIDAAMTEPPRGTRAAIRGRVVRRLTETGTPYRAEWTKVIDLDRRCILDLGDPFESVERWHGADDDGSQLAEFTLEHLARAAHGE